MVVSALARGTVGENITDIILPAPGLEFETEIVTYYPSQLSYRDDFDFLQKSLAYSCPEFGSQNVRDFKFLLGLELGGIVEQNLNR